MAKLIRGANPVMAAIHVRRGIAVPCEEEGEVRLRDAGGGLDPSVG